MLPALRTLVASETPALSSNASYSVMSGRDGVLAALAILVSAFISQGLSFSNLAFALFWPPAGIAFAVCWRFGARAIPSIALGIAVPTFILIPRWGSTLVVLGETLGPWAGVTILRRFGPTQTNDARLRWQIAFYMCGLAVACPIAALFGSLGGAVSHRFSMTDLPGVFLAYTIVEAIGLVLFAPIIIEWLNTRWSAATAADSNDLRNSTWPFVMAAGIEPMRWGLHFIAGASYADVLIFGYFPLVAWCALTATIQRTNALLLWIAIATLTSEALRLHSDGAPVANFDLFRIALVTLIVSTMGQVLAALASERRAAFADVARQRDLDPLTGLFNETSFARALDSAPRPLKVILFAFDNWPEFEILAGIGASYDLQREIADLVRQMPELTSVARLQPGTFAACLHSDADSPAPLTALLERRWSSKQVEMRLIAVALDVLEHDSSASSELLLGARTILSEALFSGDSTPSCAGGPRP
jgi:GGDEF domain-containing protein